MKWVAEFRAEGRTTPKAHRGGRRSGPDAHVEWLKARVAAKSDIALLELCAELAGCSVSTSKSALSRFFKRIDFRFKKSVLACAQDRQETAAARAA